MANRAYTDDFRLRVVAIASVRGVPEAAKRFGVGQDAIRAWMAERPDDSKLKLAADLALSELTVDIAEGRNRGRLSTHVGILMDKVARYYRPAPPVDPPTEAETWADAMEEAMTQLYPGVDLDLIIVVLLSHERLFEVEAFADVEATCAGIIAEHGTFEAARQWQHEEDHRRMLAQLEKNRQAAIAYQRKALDDETLAVLEAAERWLQEHQT